LAKSAARAKPDPIIVELERSEYSECVTASPEISEVQRRAEMARLDHEEPSPPAKTDPIGSSPVRYSEVPATSVPRLSESAHFLINNFFCGLREAEGKLSAHDRAHLFAKIGSALVGPDDIVGEVVRLVEKMTVSQRRDFIARLQKGGLLVVAYGGSPEIPIEQRKSEHAALFGEAAS
jgi:hypothetical protein